MSDEIDIESNDLDKCILSCNVKELEEDNLIYKAFDLLKKKYKIKGLNVKLIKRIPMQAGLGGGSSDVATFVKMVNEFYKLEMCEKELHSIGKKLGSDVVPCYYDVPVIGRGTGSKVTVVNSNLEFDLIVIKPELDCSTGLMYKKLDEIENRRIPRNTNKIVKALNNCDLDLLCDNLFNSFEEVVDCNIIKKDLEDSGSIGTLLCGSGSCVFGIYKDYESALKADKILSKKYKTYVCKSVNKKLKVNKGK